MCDILAKRKEKKLKTRAREWKYLVQVSVVRKMSIMNYYSIKLMNARILIYYFFFQLLPLIIPLNNSPEKKNRSQIFNYINMFLKNST